MNDPGNNQPGLSARLFALLRVMRLAIIVMCLFLAGLAEIFSRKAAGGTSGMFAVICGLAFFESLAVIYVLKIRVPQVEDVLRQNSEDRFGLIEARKWYVLALALCGGISMYGFTLRIMGVTFLQAAIFHVAGIALALYCAPHKPE